MEETNRNIVIKFRVNDSEYKLLENKFLLSKFQSRSQFLRTMILEGAVIKTDGTFQKISRNIAKIGANINQIAVRVNSTGSIYADDVQEIRRDVNELWQQLRLYQSEVQKLTQ
ncbi:MAG: plasmid mobilization relaxosome protein MobC [Ruminococcus callidus]|nr:plasmid mobilization relaxosome protein MobC [Ruminococcus callidus]